MWHKTKQALKAREKRGMMVDRERRRDTECRSKRGKDQDKDGRKRESVRLVCNIKRARKIATKQIAHIIYKTEGNIVERAIEKGNIKTAANFFFRNYRFSFLSFHIRFFFFFHVLLLRNGIERKVKIDGTTNKAYLLEEKKNGREQRKTTVWMKRASSSQRAKAKPKKSKKKLYCVWIHGVSVRFLFAFTMPENDILCFIILVMSSNENLKIICTMFVYIPWICDNRTVVIHYSRYFIWHQIIATTNVRRKNERKWEKDRASARNANCYNLDVAWVWDRNILRVPKKKKYKSLINYRLIIVQCSCFSVGNLISFAKHCKRKIQTRWSHGKRVEEKENPKTYGRTRDVWKKKPKAITCNLSLATFSGEMRKNTFMKSIFFQFGMNAHTFVNLSPP